MCVCENVCPADVYASFSSERRGPNYSTRRDVIEGSLLPSREMQFLVSRKIIIADDRVPLAPLNRSFLSTAKESSHSFNFAQQIIVDFIFVFMSVGGRDDNNIN